MRKAFDKQIREVMLFAETIRLKAEHQLAPPEQP
jgi:hypothetical protein